jgi:hypothetical protein
MSNIVLALNPIERALAALDEAVAGLAASGEPTRFAKIGVIIRAAQQLAQLRATRVEDLGFDDGINEGGIGMMVQPRPIRPFNDAVDLNREIVMLAQGFLKNEQQRRDSRPEPDTRFDEATELSELLNIKQKFGDVVPKEIQTRIDHLVKRIGEPIHEPQSDPLVHPDPVRGHSPDGAGELDGNRVGEPVPERANGAHDAR